MSRLADPSTFHAYPRKGLIGILTLAAGTVTLLSLCGTVALMQADVLTWGERLFGIALLANPVFFIGRLTLMYIRRLTQTAPEISVDAQGLTATFHSEKPISWDNISRVEISRLAKNIICVWLVDPALDPPRRKRSWLMRRMRRRADMGDMLFGVEAMEVSVSEAMAAISTHLPRAKPTLGGPVAPPPRR